MQRQHLRLLSEHDAQRPRKRGDCVDGPRPCPWVGCAYHLFLHVTKSGKIIHRSDVSEVEQLRQSCALDVADAVAESGEALSDRDLARLLGLSKATAEAIIRSAEESAKVALGRADAC